MSRPPSLSHNLALAGWQGLTVEIPDGWEIAAITNEPQGGYIRWDDGNMPRLEIKWSQQSGYVDLNRVIDKYLADIEKQQKKSGAELRIEREVSLISKRKRKRAGVKCFRWTGGTVAHGAAWVCKDCGRTILAQVHTPLDERPESAQELAAAVLHSITDHPADGWSLWSAYGLACWTPEDFSISSQKLMAGLIEFELERKTERIKVARWGMAKLALKGRPLQEWLGSELAKQFRKHAVEEPEEIEIKGHEGLSITGGNLVGAQKLQRFWEHCRGRLYADRFAARAWHCPDSNKLLYVEIFVDRDNAGLVDEIVARMECHSSAAGQEGEQR
jgi:hypothetical protein